MNLQQALTEITLAQSEKRQADLTRAHLTRADLTGADLTGADLTGADLTGAHLGDVHILQVGPVRPYNVYITVLVPHPGAIEDMWVGCERGTLAHHTKLGQARHGETWEGYYGAPFRYVAEWLEQCRQLAQKEVEPR